MSQRPDDTALPAATSVDASLVRRQLELTPLQRLQALETMYAQARELAIAGARSRGELD